MATKVCQSYNNDIELYNTAENLKINEIHKLSEL